jgi:hypothetical protein
MRLVELWVFAREAAVCVSYRGFTTDPTGAPETDAWICLLSVSDDKDAFRASLRCDGGDGGLRPECDFWPRRLPGLGDKNDEGGAAGADETAWKVWARVGCAGREALETPKVGDVAS